MRWTFDVDQGSLYLELGAGEPVEQVEMADGTIVDLDDSGGVIGIEVLSAWADWDWRAIVSTFALDAKVAASVEHVARSPLLQVRPVRRRQARQPGISPSGTTSGTAVLVESA